MVTPRIIDEPLYQLLRLGEIEEFNGRRQAGEECNLSGCDLRGLDLRTLNAGGLDMSNCYLRQADLRGIDFSTTRLSSSAVISFLVFSVSAITSGSASITCSSPVSS